MKYHKLAVLAVACIIASCQPVAAAVVDSSTDIYNNCMKVK